MLCTIFSGLPYMVLRVGIKSKLRGPALPRKRKILIISLQSQPTLVGRANKAEAREAAPARRSAAALVANRHAAGVEVPKTTPHDTVRTRRRAERVGFLSCGYTATIPVVTPFPHVSAHVVYAKCVCCFQTFLMCTITCSSACRFCWCSCTAITNVVLVPAYCIKTSVATWTEPCFSCSIGSAKGVVQGKRILNTFKINT